MIKRGIDILGSLLALLVLAPLIMALMVLIRYKMGSPVFFSQDRPGKGGEVFKFIKFRTMTSATDKNGALLSDDQRMTKIGKLMRHTSLDEMLSFWNVLKGDMSLVGPRPLLVEYLALYSPEQSRRHAVKPGITGWAQINGRNSISWVEKFELDVWYVDNKSLKLDTQILLRTIFRVISRKGINHPGSVTMNKFGAE